MKINLIKSILLWTTGIFFALAAIIYIKTSIITSICYLFLTAITLPPFTKSISFKGKGLSGKSKLIIGFLLFLTAVRFTPESNSQNKAVIQEPKIIPIITVLPTAQVTSTPTLIPTINTNTTKVTKVIDGDTIMVVINGKAESVRLIGVDTLETVDPRKPVQCFGKEASTYTKQLIEGKNVILDSDPTQGDKDKYNRLLRYVHLEDGIFVNQKLIEDGFGFEYTYNIPYQYQAEFKEAQRQAETNKMGLWADGVCPIVTPKPTVEPASTVKSTSAPTKTNFISPQTGSSSGPWTCNCSKSCTQIKSCDEAYFQLKNCGCSVRDADGDGIPCESLCN